MGTHHEFHDSSTPSGFRCRGMTAKSSRTFGGSGYRGTAARYSRTLGDSRYRGMSARSNRTLGGSRRRGKTAGVSISSRGRLASGNCRRLELDRSHRTGICECQERRHAEFATKKEAEDRRRPSRPTFWRHPSQERRSRKRSAGRAKPREGRSERSARS